MQAVHGLISRSVCGGRGKGGRARVIPSLFLSVCICGIMPARFSAFLPSFYPLVTCHTSRVLSA